MSDYLLIIDGSSLLSTQFYGNLPREVLMAKTVEEKEKFKRIYEEYAHLVYWLAEQQVHREDIAEECVQDTFFFLARHFEKVGGVKEPRTKNYIATVAKGFAIKAYHKEHGAEMAKEKTKHFDMVIPDFQFDAVTALDLSYAVDKRLSEEEKNILYLRYVYSLTYKEIAATYDTTEYFIKKTIHKAVEKLKRYLEKEE
jgi:RNA polymerase sigma factor (sigma-70 family)